MPRQKKTIFITGGVLSSLGKGISAASIGMLLEQRGLSVTLIKMDPYLNVDPGTMSPFQHGEVFVLDDGAETDLDLGHYARFVRHARFTKKNSFTTGKIYDTVIRRERAGGYLGKTVQVIPHITDEIKRHIRAASEGVDIAIVEVGGTVGDIESLPFLEAIRQIRVEEGANHVLFVHLTLVPYVGAAHELKTKPTQHSVKELREIGIQPDLLICRCDRRLPKEVKDKIGLFCSISGEHVFSAVDVKSIYEVPLLFHEEGLDERISEKLGIWSGRPDLSDWSQMVQRLRNPKQVMPIAIVGKYTDWSESYKSLLEALTHAATQHEVAIDPVFVDSEALEADFKESIFESLAGVLVPGGFGQRGIEGKIRAVQYAREAKKPFFGICLGMQLATIEFARNVCGMEGASSAEFGSDPSTAVIDWMHAQKGVQLIGASMRLGAYSCEIKESEKGSPTHAFKSYGVKTVSERHRHRFEVSQQFRERLEQGGLAMTGIHYSREEEALIEIIEIPDHPWFLGCQFHPEFKSHPLAPHPLFVAFVGACLRAHALESKAVG